MSERHVDLTNLIPIDETLLFEDDDADECEERAGMIETAIQNLLAMSWCKGIRRQYYAECVPGVIVILLFEIDRPTQADNPWIWVIRGDLPAAYIEAYDCHNAQSALSEYCDAMTEWARAVLQHKSIEGLMPVNGPPTADNARALLNRIDFLKSHILPYL